MQTKKSKGSKPEHEKNYRGNQEKSIWDNSKGSFILENCFSKYGLFVMQQHHLGTFRNAKLLSSPQIYWVRPIESETLGGPILCDLISPPGDSIEHSNLRTLTLETNNLENTMKLKKSNLNPQVWVVNWEAGFVGGLISQRIFDITLAKKVLLQQSPLPTNLNTGFYPHAGLSTGSV